MTSFRVICLPKGGLRGSINWVFPLWGRVAVTKPLSQIQRSTLLFLQEASPHAPVRWIGAKPGTRTPGVSILSLNRSSTGAPAPPAGSTPATRTQTRSTRWTGWSATRATTSRSGRGRRQPLLHNLRRPLVQRIGDDRRMCGSGPGGPQLNGFGPIL